MAPALVPVFAPVIAFGVAPRWVPGMNGGMGMGAGMDLGPGMDPAMGYAFGQPLYAAGQAGAGYPPGHLVGAPGPPPAPSAPQTFATPLVSIPLALLHCAGPDIHNVPICEQASCSADCHDQVMPPYWCISLCKSAPDKAALALQRLGYDWDFSVC